MSFLYNTLPDAFDGQLETEHLTLRPYDEGDENDFMRLLQENTSYLNPAFSGRLARVRVLEDARSQVRQLRTDWDNRKTFDFGVWQKERQVYVGDIALKNLDHSIPKAEVGLYFTDWPESEDLAREALQAVLQFAFDMLGMNRLYMRCTSTNESIGEMARHCGFVKEGTLRNDYRGVDSDELLDLSYYGITRQDYEQAWQPQGQSNTTALV
ncbi:RimJ/RimL family protein N-acetyltransferase [Pontibacter ummariensis]|uniref:Protein N-acetyltransferase, RimJ/RimL family n=1 Tax=Pontibacter ummariensis TaxID=1610492 RepID=A0A239B2M1_9BACT|nr:GNAT family protein [Pontibacter ummariensis]PRY16267.1 RimJ/RimL family protein N-acetyltransferase [Pontibacter ummariensis]SNS02195.1 Protein N-acetyltransferase, RimJ/RimL family [Pontibacter ummariensis]